MGSAGSMISQRFFKFFHIIICHIHAKSLAFQRSIGLSLKNSFDDQVSRLFCKVTGFIVIRAIA